MAFGVVLGLWNHRYFKRPLNVVCEFVPQIIFLIAIFGYLVLLIFSKWTNYDATMASCAPSLLIMLINMFLFKYPTEPCYLKNMYSGQPVIQGMLVVIALLCIPWMLFAKPYMMYQEWKKKPVMNEVKNEKPKEVLM
ncbi:hypothetical protein CEXT_642891 [Caerostris extrusa]|uniref:V-type proton ATPase subunit a n=1 Tax=Caerostris extrusa TaxID=172846 RepID=A0AAV4NIU5_CAEEX|nr:hypothetical protein CEXT_642891 [Caerostris extrusa]